MIGQRVGPYAVLQRLGGGGMGEVYLAEDTRLGRHVALKRPSEALLSMPDARERLHREASAAGRLTHPNIAAIYDVLDVDSYPYIVMEYVEGESLARVLRRGALPLDNAIAVGTEIADALAAAHAKGIVHRDLKPANISLTPDGHAKVLDFGLAKGPATKETTSQAGLSTITVPGQVMGTPGYSSPEQLVGAPADPRDDIYSLGVVLYELLCGRRPFDGTDSLELAMATMTKTPPPVHQVNPAVPEAISAIVARAMARDRDDRYQSADQLRTELRRLTHALSTDVTHLISIRARCSWRQAGGAASFRRCAAIALIAAIGAGVWWWRRPDRAAGHPAPVLGVMAVRQQQQRSRCAARRGMRDVLIAKLANTPGLERPVEIRHRRSGACSTRDPRKLARSLGATYLLEADLQRSGRRSDGVGDALTRRLGRGRLEPIRSRRRIRDIFALQQRLADGVRACAAHPDVCRRRPRPVEIRHPRREALTELRPGDGVSSSGRTSPATCSAPRHCCASAIERDPEASRSPGPGSARHTGRHYRRPARPKWASEAVNATNRALTLDQQQPEVWISLARIHEGTGRREEALSDLNRALSCSRQRRGAPVDGTGAPGDGPPRRGEGALPPGHRAAAGLLAPPQHARRRSTTRSAATARRSPPSRGSPNCEPDNARGFHNLGAVYYRIGDSRNALTNYEKALAIKPRPETRSAIGNIHYDEGRYEAALAAFLEAVEADRRTTACCAAMSAMPTRGWAESSRPGRRGARRSGSTSRRSPSTRTMPTRWRASPCGKRSSAIGRRPRATSPGR